MRNPPQPLPDQLWGDRWRFAALPAGDIADAFVDRMIPVLHMPAALLPLKLGVASTVPIPGVVIDGGRRSMPLARWLQAAEPIGLSYIAGAPDGLILAAGEIDRWILATFEDATVSAAGAEFEQRKQQSQGLHFLLVQPDDSGMTYTGFWLLGGD
jgi:RNA-binding protein Tab2/Atab2